ncbi:Metal-dependent hydrolase, endonuclease/exonuclease/phosphatase family [Prosthecobacter debontii]|uniref:Metal-dependent hydrolase, endonuclease/exonuclease/phosphatase family n=2 Tax=Prosthecobacter debontii TaxID=48467 RepID=A0A1T4WY48_9BACT|nr:Metal-dependent hydrolase, endonuclease/exonuclease/phosphatase family [Prosthecobacter debontii]
MSVEMPGQVNDTGSRKLRIMTYNVHGCIGTDGRLDESRIAEVILSMNPDVVALQELDVERKRSKGVHQARHLAEHLKMEFHFHPAITHLSEQYGDAVLSRLPMKLLLQGKLPTSNSRLAFEPRGALLVQLDFQDEGIHLLNTHLGLSWSERMAQIQALLGQEWADDSIRHYPFIFCGDLNALPGSLVYRTITRRLKDVQRWSLWGRPRFTFPSRWPVTRLDYIFMNSRLSVHKVIVPNTPLTQVASDHLPLVADLVLHPKE